MAVQATNISVPLASFSTGNSRQKMPFKENSVSEYTSGQTSIRRDTNGRFNSMSLLSICCGLLVLLIIAALVLFTFLPILRPLQENQIKYQVQSSAITLFYNLPDRASIQAMNWTYVTGEFEFPKLLQLQRLFQHKLNNESLTRKTSLTIMDAWITDQHGSLADAQIEYPLTMTAEHNGSVIRISQATNDTAKSSKTQLKITVMLRYALECGKKCQTNVKDSILEKTFHQLQLSLDSFRTLLTDSIDHQALSSNLTLIPTQMTTIITTAASCLIFGPPTEAALSSVRGNTYEAESPLNTFIASTIAFCSICSGKRKVTDIAGNRELIFQHIASRYGGPTRITIHYIADRLRSAEILVNNRLPAMNVTFPPGSSNQELGSRSISLDLCQGLNSIRISNRQGHAPDFDRIQVY